MKILEILALVNHLYPSVTHVYQLKGDPIQKEEARKAQTLKLTLVFNCLLLCLDIIHHCFNVLFSWFMKGP